MSLEFLGKKRSFSGVHDRARRHTRRIRWLRIIIPISISGLFIALMITFGWHGDFQPHPLSSSPYANINVENQLVNATLSSKDQQGRPVIIKAAKATQSGHKAVLESPESHFELEKGKDVMITSDHALYDESGKTLEYQKDVTLTTESGMVIETDQATINLEDKGAISHHSVKGVGPQGTLKGENGFEWRGNTLSLKGKSAVTLN